MEKRIHHDAMDLCKRVWMQNSNGVREVHTYKDCKWHKEVDVREFALVKLQAVEIC